MQLPTPAGVTTKQSRLPRALSGCCFFLSLVICKDRDVTTSSSPVPLLLLVLSLDTPENVVSFCVSVELSASGLETEPCLLYVVDPASIPQLKSPSSGMAENVTAF